MNFSIGVALGKFELKNSNLRVARQNCENVNEAVSTAKWYLFIGVPKEANEVLHMGKVNNQTKIAICEIFHK